MIRIFNVSITLSVFLLVITEALLLTACYIAGAFLAPLYEGPEVYLLYEGGLARVGFLVGIIMLGLYLSDLYEDVRLESKLVLVQQYCLVLGVAFLLQAILGYAKIDFQLPKWTMVIGSGLVLVAAPLWRRAYFLLVRHSLPVRKLLFWGLSPAALTIMERLSATELDTVALGYVDPEDPPAPAPPGAVCLGGAGEFERIVKQQRPDCVVLSAPGNEDKLPVQRLLALRGAGIAVEDIAATYETVMRRVLLSSLRPSQMLFNQLSPPPLNLALQNLYSYLIAAVGLLLAWPLMIVVAIAVKASSPGPVFFRQTRVGLNGAPFRLYKFRSMRADAEAQTGPVWAQKNDPRVTPVGHWLRRLRLDELPQLFNVLRGEMTMVGPRPERSEFVGPLTEKIPLFWLRQNVKPGITGWAQINHKYGDTIEDTAIKLEYDLYYIKNLSPALDALILFHTIRVIVLQRGSQ